MAMSPFSPIFLTCRYVTVGTFGHKICRFRYHTTYIIKSIGAIYAHGVDAARTLSAGTVTVSSIYIRAVDPD
jgi:hypothetical protein